jgi:pimeloyl-ACP methyl ester carboxylesterase
MKRVVLDTSELEYEIRGSGVPIVFVHHGAGADWFKPLLEDPSLNFLYRLVHFHRAGYAGSSRPATPLTFASYNMPIN